jgi:hypothetical protein
LKIRRFRGFLVLVILHVVHPNVPAHGS